MTNEEKLINIAELNNSYKEWQKACEEFNKAHVKTYKKLLKDCENKQDVTAKEKYDIFINSKKVNDKHKP